VAYDKIGLYPRAVVPGDDDLLSPGVLRVGRHAFELGVRGQEAGHSIRCGKQAQEGGASRGEHTSGRNKIPPAKGCSFEGSEGPPVEGGLAP